MLSSAELSTGENMVELHQKELAKRWVKRLLFSERQTRDDEEVSVADLEDVVEVDSVEEEAAAVGEVE